MISEYRKARGIMADVADENATEGVWHNLFLEVDKVDTASVSLFLAFKSCCLTSRFCSSCLWHTLGNKAQLGPNAPYGYVLLHCSTAVFEKHNMLCPKWILMVSCLQISTYVPRMPELDSVWVFLCGCINKCTVLTQLIFQY